MLTFLSLISVHDIRNANMESWPYLAWSLKLEPDTVTEQLVASVRLLQIQTVGYLFNK